MNDLVRSFGRALLSQLHPRMLFMTVLPFIVALVVWGPILYFGWNPVMEMARGVLEGWALTHWIYSGSMRSAWPASVR